MQFTFSVAAFILVVPAVFAVAIPAPVPEPEAVPQAAGVCHIQWFGTAPFCKGKCPSGWEKIDEGKMAIGCQRMTKYGVFNCENTSNAECWSGKKVMCVQCTP